MQIYLAARYSRRAEMQQIARALEQLGHLVTARWVSGAHDTCEDTKSALEDLEDIHAADMLVAFTEQPGVAGRARGGRHVEYGYALARGLRIVVVGPRENVFHHVPGVEVLPSVAQLIALLRREARAAG